VMLAYGLGMVAFGTWMNATLTADADLGDFLLPQMIRGHGFAFCMVPMTGLALGTLAPHEVKNGSGLFNLMRNLGGAIGLAVINTLMQHGNALHWSQLSSSITLSREPVRAALAGSEAVFGAGADSEKMMLSAIADNVSRQAATLTFNDLFHLMAIMVAVTALLLVFAEKPQAAPPADAGGH